MTSSLAKGTAVNCEEEGHDWVEGTAVDSLYCRKCGNYDSRLVPILSLTYVGNPYFEDLTTKGLQDIQEGRVHRIPNIRAIKESNGDTS